MAERSHGGPALQHRAVAELVGTAFLLAAVVGSGIAAQRLSPNDVGLQLLENALATGAALTALIIALQPVSAAFNPVVTAMERLTGALTGRHAVTLVAAQILGGLIGVVVANLMFNEPAVSLSTTDRGGAGRWLGEVVATAGLVLLITALSRTGRPQLIGWAVGAYITAGYWFTSSTSFANPAATIARMFSNTFAGIEPASVPIFLLAQIAGGAIGYGLAQIIYQRPTLIAITQENRQTRPRRRRQLPPLIPLARLSPPARLSTLATQREEYHRLRPPGRRPTTSPMPPTSSSPRAAATPARSIPASVTSIGTSPTPTTSPSNESATSATIFKPNHNTAT
jgi:glycerol uptake facilitator-like aquaporin